MSIVLLYDGLSWHDRTDRSQLAVGKSHVANDLGVQHCTDHRYFGKHIMHYDCSIRIESSCSHKHAAELGVIIHPSRH